MVLEESTNIRGWILRRTNVTQSWKKRFFVLQNDKLVYYQSLRDNKPRAIYELTAESKIVDYGVNDGFHQFSLYEDDKRVLWLAAEDNKARYWISVIRMEIKKKMGDNEEKNAGNMDVVLPPLACECNDSYCLRDSIDSTAVPSCMKELSALIHSSSLETSLTSCTNGCLSMSIQLDSKVSTPYKMVTMSIPIEMEYAAYFLVDCEFARMLWDPLFLYSREIEKLDNNNSIYYVSYKPISIMDSPCSFRSHPRDFCLHRHFSYDEETNTYFILFASTTHPQCCSLKSHIRGDLQVGYRIEAVKSGVSRITMMYYMNPQGHLGKYHYFRNQYESLFVQSLPGLRDMLSQIPEYHILNLIERIVNVCSSDTPSVHSLPEEVDETEKGTSISLPPYITNTVPHASECDHMMNCWEEVDGTIWNVRGKEYKVTKEKVRSAVSYCKLLCVDVFRSSSRINHIAQHSACAIHRMKELQAERLLIINLQITGNTSVVAYLAVPKEEEEGPVQTLLRKFYSETDSWRDAHFKLLPHIVEGGYLIKKAVGTTPCIIGTKGESSYYTGEVPIPYLECDYDMDGSTMARNLSKYLFTAGNMVVELGFVIQGEEEGELPERVLGGFRFYHLDIESAKVL